MARQYTLSNAAVQQRKSNAAKKKLFSKLPALMKSMDMCLAERARLMYAVHHIKQLFNLEDLIQFEPFKSQYNQLMEEPRTEEVAQLHRQVQTSQARIDQLEEQLFSAKEASFVSTQCAHEHLHLLEKYMEKYGDLDSERDDCWGLDVIEVLD